ncbi:MAG: hypothetical protein QNJ64_06580 [Crocosphaera sp.]|nr:hypothetical protein [Crocosphaera sp.]
MSRNILDGKINRKIMGLINHERTLAMIFLVILSILLILHNLEKPHLLILHSYALDYSWVTEQNEGMQRVLKDKSDYLIKEHYLDTKNKPYPEYMKRAGKEARELIKRWKPNIIIACDDNAQILVGKYLVNNPKVKIIFTGVQGDYENYGYNHANNVTGITEKVPPQAIKETLEIINQSLGKNYQKVAFLTHNTTHSSFVVEHMKSFDWQPFELVSAGQYTTFKDWQKAVEEAENRADILLIGGYKSLKKSPEDNSIVPYQEILDWTDANSSLLKIGARGFYVEDGGMLAIGISPYEQGEVAAQAAVDLIEKKKQIENIPIRDGKQFLIYMRKSKMRDYNINLKLPNIYESFARATNHYFD